jgi:hypothetical protein
VCQNQPLFFLSLKSLPPPPPPLHLHLNLLLTDLNAIRVDALLTVSIAKLELRDTLTVMRLDEQEEGESSEIVPRRSKLPPPRQLPTALHARERTSKPPPPPFVVNSEIGEMNGKNGGTA